jgi:hypothetical protein
MLVAAENVNAETVAVIAAGGTALGALIGAAAGGIVQAFLDRARRKQLAQVGARLISLDLLHAANMMKAAEEDRAWEKYYTTRLPAWEAHREALATKLKSDEFRVVAGSVSTLHELGRRLAAYDWAESQTELVLDDFAVGDLRGKRVEAADAYNALQRLAGGDLRESPLGGEAAPHRPRRARLSEPFRPDPGDPESTGP